MILVEVVVLVLLLLLVMIFLVNISIFTADFAEDVNGYTNIYHFIFFTKELENPENPPQPSTTQ